MLPSWFKCQGTFKSACERVNDFSYLFLTGSQMKISTTTTNSQINEVYHFPAEHINQNRTGLLFTAAQKSHTLHVPCPTWSYTIYQVENLK